MDVPTELDDLFMRLLNSETDDVKVGVHLGFANLTIFHDICCSSM